MPAPKAAEGVELGGRTGTEPVCRRVGLAAHAP